VAVGAGAVWVANGRAGTVSRIDPLTNQIVATIAVAEPSPTCERCWAAIAAQGDVVWASMNSEGPVATRIDPLSNSVAERVEVGVLPSALLVDGDGALWVTANLQNAVVRVAPRSARVVAQIAVHLPSEIAAGHDAIWVTSRKPGAVGQVVRIDPRTEQVISSIPVGHDPGALAVGDDNVWVANETDHTISRINARTNSVVATIPVVHLPVGVAVGSGAVWVASRGFSVLSQPSISRIDLRTNTVVDTIIIEGTAPIGMSAGVGSLWIASRNPDEVVRIGPVQLPANINGGEPLPLLVALGMGVGLLLTAGPMVRRSARRGAARPAPSGDMLRALLLMRLRH
jgi:YVTN family beta-propeller protein